MRVACDPGTCPAYHHWFTLTIAQTRALESHGFSLDFYAAFMSASEVFQAVVFAGCGLLIFLRRSDEWIALIASLALVVLGVFLIPAAPGSTQAANPWLTPVIEATYIWGNWLFPLLLFLLPDGRFVPRWSYWFAILWGVFVTSDILQWYPGVRPDVVVVSRIGSFILSACVVVGICGQIYRYRRVATPLMRQQIKWIGLGMLGMVIGGIISGLVVPFPASMGDTPLSTRVLAFSIFTIGWACFPVALTFAILRYRLWNIDIVVSRALVYGGLTAIIMAIYVLLVSSLGAVFHAQSNAIVAFVGAGLVAVLFQPVRQHLQRGVNRLIFGQRDEPYAVLARFGRQLESTPSLDTLVPAIVTTIKDTLKLPFVAIEMPEHDRAPNPSHNGASSVMGDARRSARTVFPMLYQGQTVGQLVVAPREGEPDVSPHDRRLLEDLARQAGVAMHAARVTAELQHARERLVTAREEERRRLRRDLHDGLGPALAAIAAQSEAARDLIPTHPDHSTVLLTDIVAQSQAATADIRRLVYNLRPPALDDLGLAGAIQAQAQAINHRNDLRVVVQADTLPPLPAAVEVAAYRIVQEALTNVVRHAYAQNCTITLTIAEDALQLEISDDGRGIGADSRAGVGLTSMRERAEELGGVCVVTPSDNTGTLVHARLPLSAKTA
jgi:signal transduction histidine kinase